MIKNIPQSENNPVYQLINIKTKCFIHTKYMAIRGMNYSYYMCDIFNMLSKRLTTVFLNIQCPELATLQNKKGLQTGDKAGGGGKWKLVMLQSFFVRS